MEPQGLVFVVTGGCGFLGSHLVKLLLETEPELRELRVFDLHIDPDLLPKDHGRLVLLEGDVGDAGAVGRALDGADVVFHTAALVDVWGRASDEAIARANVQGTRAVLWGSRLGGVRWLVFTSSMEVVGPNTLGDPFLRGSELTPYRTRLAEPYARSKAQAERLVLRSNGATVSGGRRLVTLSLRPTGIYGERHPVLAQFYRRAVGRWLPRTLPPHAEHARVYVGNVAWMHVLAARAARRSPSSVAGEFFFCYDSSPYASYEDFNMFFLGAVGLRLGGRKLPDAILSLAAWLNALLRRLLSPFWAYAPLLNPYTLAVASTPFTVRTDKAQRCFGYRPLFSWDEARARTVRWLRHLDGAS
ncbi:3 beta-hydroxysteroid dehydrogenase type 7 isoform X2 [Cuculus canorus]|uniref:3 beta-hydroxysteroid dehydrogenase type 7 isoform X2 n=1 Tax=Cuculus canorus TaxID=55661 RepID=UPI0023AB15DF|nr:3 beta-hydroxysteroid dehydrogenase type 7 isoform X2 [Cuculus canorus]